MGVKYDFDYIIIGSGPAGLTSAFILAKAKKRVAIVEGQSLGGAKIHTRDLPYNFKLNFSHTYRNLLDEPAIRGQSISFNFPTLSAHESHQISTFTDSYAAEIKSLGIKLIPGFAHFLDSVTIAVGNKQFTATRFIIATGAKQKISEISGLDRVNYLTPMTALKIHRLPRFALIAGGGPTGVEIATFYAELGAKVLIMERSTRILPREDKEISELVAKHLTKNLGVQILCNAKLVEITEDDTSKIAIFTTKGTEKMVRIDCIVLATGSEPNILDLGLENANVKYKRSGILVDKFMKTSAENIFAIGDAVTTSDSGSKKAEYEARILTSNLLHHSKTPVSYSNYIRIINTNPSIAIVGMNEKDLLTHDIHAKHQTFNLPDFNGFIKLLTNSTGHILGATIVSPHAAALANTISLAISSRLTVNDIRLANVIS